MEIEAAYAQTTKAVRRRYEPREAIGLVGAGRWRRRARRRRRRRQLRWIVLRRALGHHAVFHDVKRAIRLEASLEYHFRVGLERVGHDAGVVRADDLAVALHVEAVLERVALARRLALHEAVQLEVLAVPRAGIGHHLVNVFVVFRALAERRVQQTAERQHEHDARQADFLGFLTHK